MQEAITLICIDQYLRCYIAWLGHNKLSPKADFRKVLDSLTVLLKMMNMIMLVMMMMMMTMMMMQ